MEAAGQVLGEAVDDDGKKPSAGKSRFHVEKVFIVGLLFALIPVKDSTFELRRNSVEKPSRR